MVYHLNRLGFRFPADAWFHTHINFPHQCVQRAHRLFGQGLCHVNLLSSCHLAVGSASICNMLSIADDITLLRPQGDGNLNMGTTCLDYSANR